MILKIRKVAPDCSWIGPHQLNKTADVVNGTYCGRVIRECGFSKDSKVGVPKVSDGSLIHIIQIAEGCLGACTFCCTRFARGPLNSYPIKDIVAEAKKLLMMVLLKFSLLLRTLPLSDMIVAKNCLI